MKTYEHEVTIKHVDGRILTVQYTSTELPNDMTEITCPALDLFIRFPSCEALSGFFQKLIAFAARGKILTDIHTNSPYHQMIAKKLNPAEVSSFLEELGLT